MTKNIQDRLTFGFEIEGHFRDTLGKLVGEFKTDGSVGGINENFKSYVTANDSCPECNGSGRYDDEDCEYCSGTGSSNERRILAEEYASRIFQNLEDCLEELAVFNDQSHDWNETCGLHLHVGLKDRKISDRQKLANVVANFEFINELQTRAKTFCSCQKTRLNARSSYYTAYKDTKGVRDNFLRNKYQFVHYHLDYGTLEFRFLSPCEHKVENVRQTVKLLCQYLESKTEQHTKQTVDVAKLKPAHKVVELVVKPLSVDWIKLKHQYIENYIMHQLINSGWIYQSFADAQADHDNCGTLLDHCFKVATDNWAEMCERNMSMSEIIAGVDQLRPVREVNPTWSTSIGTGTSATTLRGVEIGN